MMPKSQKIGILVWVFFFGIVLGAALQSWNISSKCDSRHPFFEIGSSHYECAPYEPNMWGPK